MIKRLRNYSVLADGTAFKRLRLVPESMMLIGQRVLLHNWKGLLKIQLRYKAEKLPASTTYLLAHNAYQGYYHWLLESVPKLLEAQRTLTSFTLLLPTSCTAPFYADTLRLLGIEHVAWLAPQAVYRVPDLALAYSEVTMGSHERPTLQAIRQVLLASLPPLPAQVPPRRLYISRKLAPRRKVLNEEEVERELAALGFEAVCFENYTFEEQVRLCASAEIMVSIHGAGLANMVFQPEGARVIELRKFDKGENIFFSELAQALGFQYHLLYCKAQEDNQLVQDADLWVDTQALRALLV